MKNKTFSPFSFLILFSITFLTSALQASLLEEEANGPRRQQLGALASTRSQIITETLFPYFNSYYPSLREIHYSLNISSVVYADTYQIRPESFFHRDVQEARDKRVFDPYLESWNVLYPNRTKKHFYELTSDPDTGYRSGMTATEAKNIYDRLYKSRYEQYIITETLFPYFNSYYPSLRELRYDPNISSVVYADTHQIRPESFFHRDVQSAHDRRVFDPYLESWNSLYPNRIKQHYYELTSDPDTGYRSGMTATEAKNIYDRLYKSRYEQYIITETLFPYFNSYYPSLRELRYDPNISSVVYTDTYQIRPESFFHGDVQSAHDKRVFDPYLESWNSLYPNRTKKHYYELTSDPRTGYRSGMTTTEAKNIYDRLYKSRYEQYIITETLFPYFKSYYPSLEEVRYDPNISSVVYADTYQVRPESFFHRDVQVAHDKKVFDPYLESWNRLYPKRTKKHFYELTSDPDTGYRSGMTATQAKNIYDRLYKSRYELMCHLVKIKKRIAS